MDNIGAVRHVLGLALRQLRTDAGLSLRQLAETVHYHYSRLSRAERGEHLIDPAYIPAIDAAVRGNGLLTMLRSMAPDGPRPGPKALPSADFLVNDGDTVMLELRTSDGRNVQVKLSRREFAQLLAGGALQTALPGGVANLDQAEHVSKILHHGGPVTEAVLDYFRRLLAEHYTADKMLGPKQLLRPVLAQVDVLDTMRRYTPPRTANPVLKLLAQYAEFAGWLHQDAGNPPVAMLWSARASQWAQGAGDDQMAAYMLIRKSNIALSANDPAAVVSLAAAARTARGSVSPKLVALAAQQEARGWAQLGEADRFRTDLDTAAEILRDHANDVDADAPVYLRQYDLDALEEQSASCYRACGRPDTAIKILEQKIQQTPAHLARDRAHQVAKLASILSSKPNPDPDRAADLGLSCVPAALQSGSARVAAELRLLNRTLLAGWPTLPGTIALNEALAS